LNKKNSIKANFNPKLTFKIKY